MKVATGCVALCSLFIVYAASHRSFPSDAAITDQFSEHRADFEQLETMAAQDNHLVRIGNKFTWLDTDASWPRKNVGISSDRWDEYKRLFRRAGLPDGFSKDVDPPRLLFPVASRGLVPTGGEKGIVYSPVPLKPVLKSLNNKPPDALYDHGHVIAYKPIEKDWYIYYEEW